MQRIRLYLVLIAVISAVMVKAQDKQKSKLPTKNLYLAFCHPVSSDGARSGDFTYNFSLSLLNAKIGAVNGCSISSLITLANNSSSGLSLAAIGNSFGDNFKGVQLGGIFNLNGSDFKGLQIAGLLNSNVNQYNGVQFSGVYNTNNSDFNGVQFSGLVNNVKGKIGGLQFGVLNKTKSLNGVQFGIVNICDTIEHGACIGLVNVVKNGYKRLEVTAGESLNNTVSLKMGTTRFYSILAVGVQYAFDKTYFGTGIGFGSQVVSKPKLPVFFDWTCYNIYNHSSDGQLNFLNQLKLSFNKKLNDKMDLIIGPSLYIMYSKQGDNKTNYLGTEMAPYDIFNKSWDSSNVKMWLGLVAGISF